ncbi:calaxin-like [Condylostylus longicornis]|uniref:calaxin-like n=1 Tax=Condylostylus longicornis TaxID=2530218 RepID=UPI00244E21E3|nr:calaxin-like [Condylostylus longicornis]
MKIDITLDEVQNARFRNIYYDIIREYLKKGLFNEKELETVLMIYHKFVLANGPKAKYMTKRQFAEFFAIYFQIYDLRIIERIILKLTVNEAIVIYVKPQSWLNLYMICTTDSLDDLMEYVFGVYDLHDSGFLTREVITIFISSCVVEEEDDTEELTLDMVDLIIKRFDIDKDGRISYDDYCQTVRKTPDLLQFLGTCVPSNEHELIFNRKLYR